MTQFIDLVLDWNRGEGWELPPAPADWSTFAAAELPLTEGTRIAPTADQRARDVAAAAEHGCIVFASHVVSADASPDEQAAAAAAALPDHSMPLLILPPPIPREDSLALTQATLWDMITLGLQPRLVYLPAFYWHAVGAPALYPAHAALSPVMIEPPEATWTVDAAGTPVPSYPGDDSLQWASFGGLRDSEIALMRIPGSSTAAYRGTREELARLLGVGSSTSTAPSSPPSTPAAAAEPPAAAA